MKAHLTILCLILGFSSSSQTKLPLEQKERKMAVGFNISPNVDYRLLRNSDGSAQNTAMINFRNNTESPKLGVHLGFYFLYSIKSFLSVETGIHYATKGERFNNVLFVNGSDATENLGTYNMIYNFHYMEVPLRMNFLCGKNSIRFIGSVGISTGINLGGTKRLIPQKDAQLSPSTSKLSNVPGTVALSPTLSAGIEWKLLDSSVIRFEPNVKFTVGHFKPPPIVEHSFSVGLNIGYYLFF